MSSHSSSSPVVFAPAPSETVRPRRPFPWLRLVAVVLGLLCLPLLLTSSLGGRGLLTLCLAGSFFVLVKRAPGTGLGAVLVFLCLLGGLRRWLIPVFDYSGTDPLLVTVPLVAMLYLLSTRRTWRPTKLTRAILALLGLMVLEIVNPFQGGIAVGVAGALFYIAPILWYFIGRQVGTSAVLRRAIQAVIGIIVLGAIYGLCQTYFGFNAAELQWIDLTKDVYGALNVNGVIRAFSFFTSSAEYAGFLALGIILLWAAFLRGHRLALLPIPILIYAMFLESVRGAVVGSLVTCVILWAVQGRDYRAWVPRGLLALVVAVAGLAWSLSHVQDVQFSDQTAGLVQHQVSGLTNAGDSKSSTAGVHGAMIFNGVSQGFRTPIGMGLGFTTIAGRKFGAVGGSTEIDLSNMFVSLGFVGGLLYVGIVGAVLLMAFRHWQRARSLTALWLLGILLGLIGGWLNGGNYAACVLAWLCIGALERQSLALPRTAPRPQTIPQTSRTLVEARP